MPRSNTTAAPGPDAIHLLLTDHRTVEALFEEFETADEKRVQRSVALAICKELAVHDKIESKLFYPTVKQEAAPAGDAVNEGIVEHEAIRNLVKQIPKLRATDELFESRVKVLIEYVKHHVKEEESELLPKVRASRIDLQALGAKMETAKQKYASAYSESQRRKAGGHLRQLRKGDASQPSP